MKAILILTVGAPQSTQYDAINTYLKAVYNDPLVFESSFWKNRFHTQYDLLTSLTQKLTTYYQQNPLPPIQDYMHQLTDDIRYTFQLPVAFGMRYDKPSVQDALQRLLAYTNGQLSHLYVIPLFAQYASFSTRSLLTMLDQYLAQLKLDIKTEVQPPFFQDSRYIDTMTMHVKSIYDTHPIDHLLFTFHGITETALKKMDPTRITCLLKDNCCLYPNPASATCYRRQAFQTMTNIAQQLNLSAHQYSLAFHDTILKKESIQPTVSQQITTLHEQGFHYIGVVSPTFVYDCLLKTIDDLQFLDIVTPLKKSGLNYIVIPSLNNHNNWRQVVLQWCDGYQKTLNYSK